MGDDEGDRVSSGSPVDVVVVVAVSTGAAVVVVLEPFPPSRFTGFTVINTSAVCVFVVVVMVVVSFGSQISQVLLQKCPTSRKKGFFREQIPINFASVQLAGPNPPNEFTKAASLSSPKW